MPSPLIDIIQSDQPQIRDRSLDAMCQGLSFAQLLEACDELDRFRRESHSLYHKVRALFFLYAIHRFHLPSRPELEVVGKIPYRGYELLLKRRSVEAIDIFLNAQKNDGPSDALSSALAEAYHSLGFQVLAAQVRQSVRSARGNRWMFRTGHPEDHPLRIRKELLHAQRGVYPLLCEKTPVRLDLSHSAWSDIFFLGMDYPEGARVLNISVDLGVWGRDRNPRPPITTYLRVIDEPILRLTSVDLATHKEIRELRDVFDFAQDYLGLLKAAVIASGIIPPGLEGSGQSLARVLERLVGPGLGLEVVSHVGDIPKGSRLAVSTNLLASLISVCMRATGQTRALEGPLDEPTRRIVVARAILGEWLGGSGGGWQDSGGLWPAIKLIEGRESREGDPEFGISRGRLLPDHTILDLGDDVAQALQESLILVHGGMAQNVGPILEMVTEKYLLRGESEWSARAEAGDLLNRIIDGLRKGDIPSVADATTDNFQGPIQAIIPWASNHYTEVLIDKSRQEFGDSFHGFGMLGGMSGGGMGFFFSPSVMAKARDTLGNIMRETKREMERALPFAMDPVVYDFSINREGTSAALHYGESALLPTVYYSLWLPDILRHEPRRLSSARRRELDGLSRRRDEGSEGTLRLLFDRLFPEPTASEDEETSLKSLLEVNGFDRELHEQIRSEIKSGRLGLAQNRLPRNSLIEDVEESDVRRLHVDGKDETEALGRKALEEGRVLVVTLAAGVGSRWTEGAGVVKALHPFCRLGGRHRDFVDVHLAKSRKIAAQFGQTPPHVFTTSYLTHEPIRAKLDGRSKDSVQAYVSPGRSIGLRMVPTERDLRFAWEEMPQQVLEEQAQKVRQSLHAALIGWARECGEASDYRDNIPTQCIHPVGHWFEIPNLLRNGVLSERLKERPSLQTILLHNIDTLGASLDPALLGLHLTSGSTLSFEVIPRRLDDRGGGLARVDGRVRLVEGLAMPREQDEFNLSYYNSMTTWIDIDGLLSCFSLTRDDLDDRKKIDDAVRRFAQRVPSYITLKDVKKRWGHGQEDVFPVAQFEKLWGDMTAMAGVDCQFLAVDRMRGQQLKDPAQLDGWLRDGSAASVEQLCDW